MTTTIFNIVQLILAGLLTAIILLQQKGAGLGGVFGGSSNIYSTKRGVEKILHTSTIVLSAIFFLFSLIRLAI
ncbi:MAG: preprotein translocase subunit SecG [Patescibacteria group bacterium]